MTDAVTDPVVADWERFRRLPVMRNHWDRPGWWPGRQSFHWFLTFDDADDLRTLAAACQQRLDYPFLDPVTPGNLHLTVRRLAFTDEVTPADVDTVIAKAADGCCALAPFTVRIGPLAGSAGALRFTVTPWQPLLDLHAVVSDAVASIGAGLDPSAGSHGFRPHIGIAYCNTTVPTATIVNRVAALRVLPPVDVHVQTLTLVRLRRDNHSYHWDTVARLPLSGDPHRRPHQDHGRKATLTSPPENESPCR
jgi:2'-5' RNA ligase